jgi:hypothetical protein
VKTEEVQSILELFPEQSQYLVEHIERNKQNLSPALEVATQTERSLETLYRVIVMFDVLGGKFYGLSEHILSPQFPSPLEHFSKAESKFYLLECDLLIISRIEYQIEIWKIQRGLEIRMLQKFQLQYG